MSGKKKRKERTRDPATGRIPSHPYQPDAKRRAATGVGGRYGERRCAVCGRGSQARARLDDPEIVEWLKAMEKLGLVPVKRRAK